MSHGSNSAKRTSSGRFASTLVLLSMMVFTAREGFAQKPKPEVSPSGAPSGAKKAGIKRPAMALSGTFGKVGILDGGPVAIRRDGSWKLSSAADGAKRVTASATPHGKQGAISAVELYQPPNGVNAYTSDAECDNCGFQGQSIAENFVVSTGGAGYTASAVTVWGIFAFGNLPTSADSFTVIFHQDAGGVPGANVCSFGPLAGTRTATGNTVVGFDEYQHVINLPGGCTLPDGTYWVEVFNDTSVDPLNADDWYWETGTQDPVHGLQFFAYDFQTPGASWNNSNPTDDALAVQIDSLGASSSCGPVTFFSESFAQGLGAMAAIDVCGGGGQWYQETICGANAAPGHTGPGAARFGVPGNCGIFSFVQTQDYLQSPVVNVAAAGGSVRLDFNYSLAYNFPSSSWANRARVEVIADGGPASVIADSGGAGFNCGPPGSVGLNNLVNGAGWQPGSFTVAATSTLQVRFVGEAASTSFIDQGEGFFIDDVLISAGIDVLPPTLPPAFAGTPYSVTLTAVGGTAPYTFTIVGALPPGLTSAPLGPNQLVISGTPTATGSFSFDVTATDASGACGTRSYTIIVGCGAVTLSPATLPLAIVGVPYSVTITASGGLPPYTFVVTGALPPGLVATPAPPDQLIISGVPTTSGSYPFTVDVTDANGCPGTQNYTIAAIDGCTPVQIYGEAFPATLGSTSPTNVCGAGGQWYQETICGANGAPGHSGPGAARFGTPGNCGAFSPGGITQDYLTTPVVNVTGAGGSVRLDFNYSLAYNNPAPSWSNRARVEVIVDGGAPAVIADNGGAGFNCTGPGNVGINNLANFAGWQPSTFTIAATNSLQVRFVGEASSASFVNSGEGFFVDDIAISTLGLSLSPAVLPGGNVGVPYSQTITASGGVAPYAFTVTGALPPGLVATQIAPDQLLISGTPTATGTFTFDVTATDANGCVVTLTYSITIGPCAATTTIDFQQDVAGAVPNGFTSVDSSIVHFTDTLNADLFVADFSPQSIAQGLAAFADDPSQIQIDFDQRVTDLSIDFGNDDACCSNPGDVALLTVFDGATQVGQASVVMNRDDVMNQTVSITVPGGFTQAFFAYADPTGNPINLIEVIDNVTFTTSCCPAITLSPATLPNGNVGSPYSQTITASGGVAPYTFTVVGALPPGLTATQIAADQLQISGTPTATGTFTFDVTATDANGCLVTVTYSITIDPCVPFTTTIDFEQDAAGAVPNGFTSVDSSIVHFTDTLNADLQVGDFSPQTIGQGLVAFFDDAGQVQIDFDQRVTDLSMDFGNDDPNFTNPGDVGLLTVFDGATQVGQVFVAMNRDDVMNQTVSITVPGGFTQAFFVYADSALNPISLIEVIDNVTFTTSCCPAITVSPATLPNGTVGVPYSQTVTASGGVAPYTFVVTGALPPGLVATQIAPDQLQISGTPTTAGTFNFDVTATDANGCAGTTSYTVTIGCPTITLSPGSPLPGGVIGTPYSVTITASGGTAPYTFVTTALPPGLIATQIAPDQLQISGTPTTAGTFNFDVTATDANGCVGTQNYDLTIATCLRRVAVYGAPGVPAWNTEVQQKLVATGQFSQVDAFLVNGGNGTPTLAQLQAYDAVFVYSDTFFDDTNAMGDVLADYMDAGGGVVVATFAFWDPNQAQLGLGGRYSTGGYSPFTQAQQASPGGLTLVPLFPGHPILQGVTSFNGGTSSYHNSPIAFSAGVNQVANWSNGQPLIAEFTPTSGPSVGLNFYPPSTDSRGDFWDATTDGALLMANALTFAARFAPCCPTITLSPASPLPGGALGTPYSVTITASGGVAPYTFTTTALPPGLVATQIAPDQLQIAGTPTAAGTFNFDVTATDANGCSGTQNYDLTIALCGNITVLPATLPDGVFSVPYSQFITAVGGTPPYTFAVTAGVLPPGLSLTPGGLLSGTPTLAGTYTFDITATDANGCTGVQSYTLIIRPIACGPITVSPSSLPNANVGVPYTQIITASGGAAPYTFAVTAGALPPGLTLTAGGLLSGTPTTSGTFNFTITATDTNTPACTGSLAYTLVVDCPAITIIPAALVSGTVGTPYSQLITAGGGTAPYTFAVTAGALPPGLTLSPTGLLSGTPTTAGTFNFDVTATDAFGCTGTRSYSLTINPFTCNPITLSPAVLPNATLNVAYSQVISAAGGTAPYTFAVTVGGLPPGLTLAPNGLLSGIPTTNGTFNFTVTATDANGCQGSQAYTIVVSCPTINIAPAALPAGTVNTPYSQLISAGGGTGPYTFAVTAGALPPGITLSVGGLLSGTPTAAGTFNFDVTATDVTGCTGVRSYTLVINAVTCNPITLSPPALPNGIVNVAYTQVISASGGTPPYAFTVTAGALPPGITLFLNGLLTGTPTVTGTFNFTVTATDANNCTGTQAYTIIIGCPAITINPGALPSGTVNSPYSQVLSAGGGTGPYTFSVTAGALPPGLTLSTAGLISGTPTTAGTFNFDVTATDVTGCTGVRSYSLTINPITCGTITLSPASLPNGVINVAYNQVVTAGGGTAPYTFTVTAGALPTGLTLFLNGQISGIPTTAGTFNFTITATDVNGCQGSQAYTVIIACGTITVSPAALQNGTVGVPYTDVVSAGGGTPPYTFAVTAGAVPPGLTLAPSGVLSGVPTTAGTYNFDVTATDATGCTGTASYTVVINPITCGTITLNPAALPNGTIGIAYAQLISASGGTAPYTFTVTAGALPPGLTLGAGGLLSGIPTTAGTFNFTVTATDANGCTGTQAYTIVIACGTITLLPAALPNGTVNTFYSQVITAGGGTSPSTFAVTAGALPPGLGLSSAGLLSGTPTTAGTFNFDVTATDATGCTGTQSYTLVIDPINCPAITLNPAALPAATLNVPYVQAITASGGTAPYTFAVTAGALPPGLVLAPNGLLSGTPTTNGTFNFDVTATDVNGCTGVISYTLDVNCAGITVLPAALPAGTVGTPYSQIITAGGGTPPYTFAVTAGALPAGLTLSPVGLLSGTPTTAGTFNFTVTATDATGCTGSQAYTLVINPTNCGAITVSPATVPDGVVGYPYVQGLAANGGTAPYVFTITAGALPPGLTLSTAGLLAGTPTTIGVYTFTVTATDLNGCAGAQSYTMKIRYAVDYVLGQGDGLPNLNRVRVYTGGGVPTGVDFLAYVSGQWGVNVGSGDINGGIIGEILTGPGPGPVFGPQVRAFQNDGTPINKVNYYAYATLRYGVNVDRAELDGDGFDEILTGAGPGAAFGPHVRGWNFDNNVVSAMAKVSFFAYGTLKYGVNVSSADLDADGYGEMLTGPGPGIAFPPQVKGWNYDNTTVTAMSKVNFNAFTTTQYGATVAGGDVDGDGFGEITASQGPGPSLASQFRGFNYDNATVAALPGYNITPFVTFFGGRIGQGDVTLDDASDLIAGAGPDALADSTVKSFSYNGAALTPVLGSGFIPFGTATYGVNVAGGTLSY
ncbi:MAG: Ig domain-containing protein [Acidobacteriota bacterium]